MENIVSEEVGDIKPKYEIGEYGGLYTEFKRKNIHGDKVDVSWYGKSDKNKKESKKRNSAYRAKRKKKNKLVSISKKRNR